MATLTDDKLQMFSNRLTKVYRHRTKQAKRLGITCYRVYDHDLPEFPLCIEIYNDKLYVAEYRRHHNMSEDEHRDWLNKSLEIISSVLQVPTVDIFIKMRQRKPGRVGQYQKIEQTQSEFVVNEQGLKFIINLSDYLDSGLFLDHRITRQTVRKESKGKKVLNLFAYTGSFSVYAAAGGASQVWSVDLSKTYLDIAKRNMELNGFKEESAFRYIHADVVKYLLTVNEKFDLVVLDPPTFSNSKRMEDFLDIQRDHVTLINQCLSIMNEGAVLYFSTNYTKFELEEKKLSTSTVREITKATTSFDFEGSATRRCFRITKP